MKISHTVDPIAKGRLPAGIAISLLLLSLLSGAAAEEIKCRADQRLKDGEERRVSLKLVLEQDRVVGLAFEGTDSFVGKGNPMAVWQCSIDTAYPDGTHDIKWSGTTGETVLETKDKESGEKSTVRIDKQGSGYKVSFVHMSGYYCGNSEFPKSVRVEKGKPQCAVVY